MSETYSGADNGAPIEELSIVNTNVNNSTNHTKRARLTKYERKIEYEMRVRSFLKSLPQIYDYLDLLSSYPSESLDVVVSSIIIIIITLAVSFIPT